MKAKDVEGGINILHRLKYDGQATQPPSSLTTVNSKPEFNMNLQASKLKPSFANIAVELHMSTSTLAWIIDTGGNVPISPDKKDFLNFRSIEDIPIFSVNDEASISGIGF